MLSAIYVRRDSIMQRLKIAVFSIAFLSLVCQAGCKSGDSGSQKSNSTSIQDVTEVSEEKSTDTTAVDDPEKNASDSADTNTGNATDSTETEKNVKDNGSITATGSQSAVTSAKGKTSSPSANESTDSTTTVSPSQETTRQTETTTASAETREENSISSTDANTNSNEGEWDFNAPNKF